METENYNVIGVMSGTSLDGVDLAHIRFSVLLDKWSFELLECETIGYSASWIGQFKNGISLSAAALSTLNSDYTKLLAGMINDFIAKHKILNLDAVCSHGHTILHQPQNGVTLQIGNLPEIALLLNQKVVCDFRVADVQLGGQGAPLVPIGDRLLFSEYDYCLNLGGFSNVSFESDGNRIAFDISPVNTVLNFYAHHLGFDYDDEGRLAKSGTINPDLLRQLNALEFYTKSFPKSLGYEFVKEMILPLMETFPISIPDKLRTFTEHVAIQIALSLSKKSGKLMVTGGGAYNLYLISRMHFHLPQIQIVIPNKKLLEFKEALIFGLLGVLKLRNEINVLSSVTGATSDHSSGNIF